jgi:glycerol-3-phosphate acyltransferase PlsY
MTTALAISLAYLVGCIPFSFLVARLAADADIRQLGDENVGAANVFRHVGLVPGIAALAGDVGKGALAVIAAQALGAGWLLVLFVGVAVLAGHNWPATLHFRGGRGASATAGVLLVLAPGGMLISFALAALLLFATRNMLWCTLGLFTPVPFLCWFLGAPASVAAYAAALPALVGLTHALTVRRLSDAARKEAAVFWVAVER